MNLRDYDYVLPPDLVAQKPPTRRQDARLLVIRRSGGSEHRQIPDLTHFLNPGDLLVLNDTKVVPARLTLQPELLASLEKKGVIIARLTLHVGTGTFLPVKNLEAHRMEPERFEIPQGTIAAIERAKAAGGRVVAVGTTSCRTLESWART